MWPLFVKMFYVNRFLQKDSVFHVKLQAFIEEPTVITCTVKFQPDIKNSNAQCCKKLDWEKETNKKIKMSLSCRCNQGHRDTIFTFLFTYHIYLFMFSSMLATFKFGKPLNI